MRFVFYLIFCFFFSSISLAQDLRKRAPLQKDRDGVLYLKENGKNYKVLHDIITVKLKDSSDRSAIIGLKVVYTNIFGYMDIEVPKDKDIEKLVENLRKHPNIETVDYNSEGEFEEVISNDTITINPPSSDTSSDPLINRQWYLLATNTLSAIDTIQTVRKVPTVAILDTGLDIRHLDIMENIFTNRTEIFNNGIDDDKNGYIDDYIGWNFYANTNVVQTDYYHGTSVAGVVAAEAHNQLGIRGVTHNYAKNMPICIGLEKPISSLIDKGILYAVRNGADVINLSLSISENAATSRAIEYAISKGVTIIAAAGNQAMTKVAYPAIHPNVIAVGASTEYDTRYFHSCYNEGLDFVAPGENIFTTLPSNEYGKKDGTSFACPQVSAVAALMYVVNPAITPDTIFKYIGNTCRKMPYYEYTLDSISKYPYGTWDIETGYGCLNATAAIAKAQENYPFLESRVMRLNNHVQVNYGIKGVGVPIGGRIAWNVSFDSPETVSSYHVETIDINNHKLHIYTNSGYLYNTLVYITIYNVKNEIVCRFSHLIRAMSTNSFYLKEGTVKNTLTILANQETDKSTIATTSYPANNEMANITIYSLNSNMQVLHKRIDLFSKEITIDISQLPPGLYALQMRGNEGIILSEKFVKKT